MFNQEYLIGIDAGTSGIKAVLFDTKGNEIGISSVKNETITSNGNWTEQDMRVLWDKLCFTIRDVLDKSGIDKETVKGIAITGQGEGCWLVDSDGNPIQNAILWSDGRSGELVDDIRKDEKKFNRIKKITGSYIFPGATSIILKWLKGNQPEALRRAKYCFFCKDFLRFKLTGEAYLDVTDASTSLLDLKTKEISDEVLDILDISDLKELFSKLKAPYDLAGYVTNEASEATGLPKGTPVAAGMMDIVASAVGTGVVNIGDSCTILGTTCCNEIVKDNYNGDSENLSGFECHAVDGLYLNVIAPMAGTPNIDWIVNNLCSEDKKNSKDASMDLYEYLELKMKDIPPGSGGLIYHPYISPAGERAPFFNPYAKAQFFGISNTTTRYHLLKAVYEGIAFSIKDCLQGADNSGKILLTGGGAKSSFWGQTIADCTGRELILIEGCEYTARGAALAAGVAVGVYKDIKEAALNTINIKGRYIPDMKRAAVYDEFYKLYRDIRERNNELWNLRGWILENITNIMR